MVLMINCRGLQIYEVGALPFKLLSSPYSACFTYIVLCQTMKGFFCMGFGLLVKKKHSKYNFVLNNKFSVKLAIPFHWDYVLLRAGFI